MRPPPAAPQRRIDEALDLGIARDPMLYPAPPGWAHFLPGYGGFRVLTGAMLTPGFTQGGALLTALAWLAGAAAVIDTQP